MNTLGPDLTHLRNYYDFGREVLDAVQDAADRHHGKDFVDLANAYGLHGPKIYVDGLKHAVEYMFLKPSNYDSQMHHNVLFAPMNTPIDENMAMRAMRLQAASSGMPLVVIGAPSYRGGIARATFKEALDMFKQHSLRPITDPVAQFLESKKIESANLMGLSLGSDTAISAVNSMTDKNIQVETLVGIESPSIVERSMARLAMDFKSGEPALDAYVRQSQSIALDQGRELARVPFEKYAWGLLNLTNLAIGRILSDGMFVERAIEALQAQPNMHMTLGWGTASELAPEQAVADTDLVLDYAAGKRVRTMWLQGMHHAGGDDINLHAAIMLEGLHSVNAD